MRWLALALLLPAVALAMPALDPGYPVSNTLSNAAGANLSVTAPATASGGRLMVAVVAGKAGTSSWPVTVSGLGLTWTQVVEASNASSNGAAIWAAWAPGIVSGAVTMTLTTTGSAGASEAITVYAFNGTKDGSISVLNAIGASNLRNITDTAGGFTINIDLVGVKRGSAAVVGFHWNTGNGGTAVTANASTTMDLNFPDNPSGATEAVGRMNAELEGTVTLGVTNPTTVSGYVARIVAAEILASPVAHSGMSGFFGDARRSPPVDALAVLRRK